MSETQEVCPVVLRRGESGVEVLAYVHPSLGRQFVTGSMAKSEPPEPAARRVLRQQSGVSWAGPMNFIGALPIGEAPTLWHLFLIASDGLQETWTHTMSADGALVHGFFWLPLDAPLDEDWHADFVTLHNILTACKSDLERLFEAGRD